MLYIGFNDSKDIFLTLLRTEVIHMRKLYTILLSLLILLILLIQIYPIFWIFTSSMKTQSEFQVGSPFSLPNSVNIKNYINAFEKTDLARYFLNSFIITVTSIICIVLFSSMAAFALEKMKFKISKVIIRVFLAGIMIPVQVTLIPLFIIYQKMGLLNSYFSLILPQVGFALPMSIYLFTAFYKYIPGEIVESAVMDGSSLSRIFRSIVIPMSKNTIITVLTMNAIFIWNEFVLGNTFISKSAMKTIPISLYDFQGDFGMTDWGATFAAISITILPVLILYFLLNKSVVSGMAAGAIKG